MAFGTMMQDLLGSLSGYLDGNGVIIPGREDMVNEVIKQIRGEGIDVSVVSVENPETHEMESKIQMAEYTNPEGEVIPATVYDSPSAMYDGVTAAGEGSTLNDYFGTSDIYIGVLSTGGGEKLAKALTLACGAGLTYSKSEGSHWVNGSHFSIEIIEAADANSPPAIKGWLKPSADPKWVYIFDYDYAVANGCVAIKYIIRKGAQDCYLKGFYSRNDTEPTEADFSDISMNAFTGFISGVIHMRSDGHRGESGFSIVGVENKVDMSDVLSVTTGMSSWSISLDSYALVLWKDGGTPFFVAMAGFTDDWTEPYASTEWSRVVTGADDQVVSLAPIFNPGSYYYGSKNSFWAMIIAEEGEYELSLGTGGSYYYDHGFALRLY